MATAITTSDSIYSNGSPSNNFKNMRDWFMLFRNEMVPSTLNYNPKLNVEIHLAITEESSEYASSICDHLFSLYHNAQHRLFVLQFLPSFVTVYYDVLYHNRHLESIDAKTKTLMDDEHNERNGEFRIPNLTFPSVYHTPNSDYYAPTLLTQQAISKHEQKCEVIRLQSFTPFDTVNGTTKEKILWFLLIQYGLNVSSMDKYSRQSYINMSKKLLGQGFSFNHAKPPVTESSLPPTGRRIHVSSRIMSEILGTLFYFKFNSFEKEVDECMRLLKQRAEYEMYPDVILMTESMGCLHELENKHSEQTDTIGIEIELPPTIDMVRQKRTATTTRSMKNRQRTKQQNDITVRPEGITDENMNIISASSKQKSISDLIETKSPTFQYKYDDDTTVNFETSAIIDEARSNISSSIGPAASTPSPSSTRNYKPVSLTSTQTYFKHIQQQRSSSPVLQVKTMKFTDDKNEDKQSVTVLPHSSNRKHGEKKDIIATVRFRGDTSDEKETHHEETYL